MCISTCTLTLLLARRIRVLFSTDVAAMGVDTPDLNIGVSLGEISFSSQLQFSVNSVQEQLEQGGAWYRLQEDLEEIPLRRLFSSPVSRRRMLWEVFKSHPLICLILNLFTSAKLAERAETKMVKNIFGSGVCVRKGLFESFCVKNPSGNIKQLYLLFLPYLLLSWQLSMRI